MRSLPVASISTIFTPAVNRLMKSLFFFTKRFSLLIFCIILFHSAIGYSSRHGWKTERLRTKPSSSPACSCFFKGAGSMSLPFASTLHSYVPTMAFKQLRLYSLQSKYRYILPLCTTFYHFVDKFRSFQPSEAIRLKIRHQRFVRNFL